MTGRVAAIVVGAGLAAVPSVALSAQGDMSTVVGVGTAGYSGDGGPATAAQLKLPASVAVTADGGFLISDADDNRVRKVSASGVITTVAGTGTLGSSGDGGPATAARLAFPNGLAVTADGGFLVADSFNGRVRKVSADGTISTVAGGGSVQGDNGPATSAQLIGPTDVASTADGGFLIVDADANRVRKVSASGTIATVAGTGVAGFNGDGPATSSQLALPGSVKATADGGFLIGDFDNHRIRKVLNGQMTTVAGSGVAGFNGDGPATSAQLTSPNGITTTADGGFLFTDFDNHRIRKVLNGQMATVAGTGMAGSTGDGGPALAAQLNHPDDVAVTAAGTILIAEADSHRVRMVEGQPAVMSPAGSCAGLTATILGTAASETIAGTSGPDVIVAGDGNDVVIAGGGNDVVCGGAGNDRLKGGGGKDRLLGETGKDRLSGGGGRRDVCKGGPQKDRATTCEKVRSL